MTEAFGVAAGMLQLVVPSYGLKLLRRFGADRVGWFLVMAFASLGTLHLLEPTVTVNAAVGKGFTLNCIYAVGSVFLVIGMAHLDTFFAQRDQSNVNEEMLRSRCEALVKKETASLTRTNSELMQEIVRRKQTEAALRESETQYRNTFTENPEPMWIFDLRESRILGVNKAALKQYGFTPEEFMRLTPQDLLPPDRVAEFMKHAAQSFTGVESRTRWQHYRKDQSLMDVEVTARDLTYAGSPARLMVIHNITEQQQREWDRYQSAKMELVSQISAGVAHHFNNLLTVIQNHASLLRQRAHDAATGGQLDEILSAGARGSSLAYQLLAASGRQLMQPKPVDLNRIMANMNLVLRRMAGEKVTVQNLCGTNPLPVLADPQIMESILVTLVKNAREAIADEGTITLATCVVRVQGANQQEFQARETEYVRLTVRDTGCGMSQDVQQHLFEPFFTTKEPGKGNGLGLAGVFGAVQQHWGWIECSSEPGAGTEFRIFLPVTSEALSPSAMDIQAAAAQDRGTVLLVDPDDRSRGVARYILNRSGYRVVEADSTAIATLLWESQARGIDLVMTDLALPGMSGFDFSNQLRQTRPGLKVICTCATEAEAKQQKRSLGGEFGFVSKPYNPEKLLETVETLIGEKSGKKG